MSNFGFNRIILSLDDRAVQKIIREINHRELAEALMATDAKVRDKVSCNMSKLAAAGLKAIMENIGPVSQEDIDKAQREIISIFDHLCDTGEIAETGVDRFPDDIIACIEDACKNKRLSLSSSDGSIEEIKCAFEAFQNRRDELTQIQELHIDSNLLPAVTRLFETDTIQKLIISGCDYAYQWPSSMENCHNLISLEISSCNGLIELPSWIRYANSLRCLAISDSAITSIPDWIGDLQSLTELTLYRNKKLHALPDSIGNLYSLSKLSLWGIEYLKLLPDSIGNLRNLTDLDIWNLSIELLPESIGNLQSLKTLKLGCNENLRILPSSIGNLQSLKKLELCCNKNLKTLPDNIGNLQSLTELSVSSNENLDSLPDSIGNLQSLEILSLRYNKNMKALPDSIGNLQSLIELSLSENRSIKSLPDSIGNLNSLSKLSSQWENLENLPDSIGNLQSLTELSLCLNDNLNTLPDSIGNLQSLTKLSLCNNKNLKSIPDSIGNLKNLTTLDIHSSSIEQLPDSIVNLSSLEYLNICRTNIHSVPQSVFSIKTFIDNKLIEIIPQKESLSYRGFVNCYYKLVKAVLQFNKKERQEGLLELEEEVKPFADDDFYSRGIRLVVDGTDAEVIRQILTTLIDREHDYYRKKLMQIALEGILGIQSGESSFHIVILLNSMVEIKDNPIDAAWVKYLAGDQNAFTNIDFDAAIQPEEEREEIRFVKRAVSLSEKAHWEGLLALEGCIDHDGIVNKDVFEYGLSMIECARIFIDDVLTRLISHETDPVQKNIALAKKEAVLSIHEGDNTRITAQKLCAYFDKSIAKILEEELFND